ncbi:MAG: hypothetical protein K8R92_00745 [Planctomycetes bacterium]|nr:hypothetical protein [Planctomycetota bacterium]
MKEFIEQHRQQFLAKQEAKLNAALGLDPPAPAKEKSFTSKAKQYLTIEAEHAIHGPASAADAAARRAKCDPCEWNRGGHCQKCGCRGNPRGQIVVRVTLAGAECPLPEPEKKWRAVKGIGGSLKTAGQALVGVAGTIAHQLIGRRVQNPK